MRSFGVKKVDLGGMSRPSWAVRSISPHADGPDEDGRLRLAPVERAPARCRRRAGSAARGARPPGRAPGGAESRSRSPAKASARGRRRVAGAARHDEGDGIALDQSTRRAPRWPDRRAPLEPGRQHVGPGAVGGQAVEQTVDGLHAQLVLDQLADVGEREVVRAGGTGPLRPDARPVRLADAVAVVPVGDEDGPAGDGGSRWRRGGPGRRPARRGGRRPSSSTTSPSGSPGVGSSSVSPVARDSPQIGERLASVARVRSRRSVEAFGVVRSWGKTPPPRPSRRRPRPPARR